MTKQQQHKFEKITNSHELVAIENSMKDATTESNFWDDT